MKLALVRQRFTDFGGAEQYLGNLARRLAGLGHEVHLLAREWPTEKESGLILHRIKCGGPSFLRMRSFARQAASLVKEAGFDLVHSFERTYSQDIFRAGDGCHAEWLLRRARAQGRWRRRLDRVNPKHRAFLDLEARLFSDPRLKLVLANSQRGRAEVLQHYGWPESRVRVLYNGLDHDRFHPGLAARYREEVRAELGLSRD
ncbi:MAG: glycosyltransferase family 4 protein, partial [Pseudomonadota bacterium]